MSSFSVHNKHTNIEEMENHWVIDRHVPIGITSFDSRSVICYSQEKVCAASYHRVIVPCIGNLWLLHLTCSVDMSTEGRPLSNMLKVPRL